MIRRGDKITWLPQWRDAGDDKYTFVAVEDEHRDGSFYVSTVENTMFIRPQQLVRADMVQHAEPFLPVAAFIFRGLARAGARVELRRTLGDTVLGVHEDVVARSQFRDTFRKLARDCQEGEVLGVYVEFPQQNERQLSLG